jgi:acyl carrier protein phosphodiesterase
MNFLSHYYFERKNEDSYMVMGVVLPDFIKNAHKEWNLHPEKQEVLFEGLSSHKSILTGWNKHLKVDKIFHNSRFFREETAVLKQIIIPATLGGPVKPFFLAHIALELILDHLLTVNGKVNIAKFYDQLSEANAAELKTFLKLSGLPDLTLFSKFIEGFISSRYLLSYQKIENITYALNRICMRLWNNPFTEAQLDMLTKNLKSYKESIETSYMEVFYSIETVI